MIERYRTQQIKDGLQKFPAIGIVGARQVGKTTLAKLLMKEELADHIYIDLEKPSDQSKLQNAELFFEVNRRQTIIIDEIQRRPDLFPILRSEIDIERRPGRFILLGSSSPDLLRQSAESLAGRIKYIQLNPFNINEIPIDQWKKLWLRGGFPEALLSKNNTIAFDWISAFLESYIQRDLPALGLSLNRIEISRLMSMLAHLHGQMENASGIARSLGVSQPTVRKAIDFMEQAFIVNRLPAWFTNAKKRIIRSGRVYIADTGLLHTTLGLTSYDQLLGHPVAGFSFEGFVISQFKDLMQPEVNFYHYRTQDGTECDLVITLRHKVILCVEIKISANPIITKSMRNTYADLKPEKIVIITPHSNNYYLDKMIQVIGVEQITEIIKDINS